MKNMRMTGAILFVAAAATVPAVGHGVSATGGDQVLEKKVDGIMYRFHVYTNTAESADFDVDAGGEVEYLIVAGGGGGGGNDGFQNPRASGGGGAGGLLTNAGSPVVLDAGDYTITVGAGGAGNDGGTGANGEDSSIVFDDDPETNWTAKGGGGGGGHDGGSGTGPGQDGTDGGSGGGPGRQAEGGEGEPEQGHDGAASSGDHAGGGGGGAGRGDAPVNPNGEGGTGGGGAGGEDGDPNTGGGGGGGGVSGTPDSGAGGSGIVIVRYPIPQDTPTIFAEEADGINTDRATLRGRLFFEGDTPPTVRVYWAEGADCGTNSVSAWDDGDVFDFGVFTGETPTNYAHEATVLIPGTLYTYRYYATNEAGQVWGRPVTFTTWDAPGAPTLDEPTGNTWYSVDLSGALNGGVPSPHVFFCLNPDLDGGTNGTNDWDKVVALGEQEDAFAETVMGLESETTYYVRVFVSNEVDTAWSSVKQFETGVVPERFVVVDDQQIGQEILAISGKWDDVPGAIEATGELPDYTFTWFDVHTVDFAGHTLTYTRQSGNRGAVTFDLGGAAIENTVGGVVQDSLSLRMESGDDFEMVNAGTVSMGGIDTSHSSHAGNIMIGTSQDPVAGNMRFEYLHCYGGSDVDGGQDGIGVYNYAGNIALYVNGSVSIADSDGNPGDIQAWGGGGHSASMRPTPYGNVAIVHKGDFIAGVIKTRAYAPGGNSGPGNITLESDQSGDLNVDVLDISAFAHIYSQNRGHIRIRNYRDVNIGEIDAAVSRETEHIYSAQGGDVTITNGIVGDIHIAGPVDLSLTNAPGTHGALALAADGAVTLGSGLDLGGVRLATISSGAGVSEIKGTLGDFEVSAASGVGTMADPRVAADPETRLRVPFGQIVYYNDAAGANNYLGGFVWQLKALDGSSDGGLLVPVSQRPGTGTVILFR